MKGVLDDIVPHQQLVDFRRREGREAIDRSCGLWVLWDHFRSVEGVVDITRDGERFTQFQPVVAHRRNFTRWIQTFYDVGVRHLGYQLVVHTFLLRDHANRAHKIRARKTKDFQSHNILLHNSVAQIIGRPPLKSPVRFRSSSRR